ncbi:hypothetical protein [Flavobacterium coralii]|tara:strand:- start:399 stop:542 length:144 start_codon:yes stop_codon:yes gene_type:complete
MKTIFKFLIALLAGFGVVSVLRFATEAEWNEEEEWDIHNEEEYPLFV